MPKHCAAFNTRFVIIDVKNKRQEFWEAPPPHFLFLDSWVGQENCPSKLSFGQAAVSWEIQSHDPWGIPHRRSADRCHQRDKDSQKEPSLVMGMVKPRRVSGDEVAEEWPVGKQSHLCRRLEESNFTFWLTVKDSMSLGVFWGSIEMYFKYLSE